MKIIDLAAGNETAVLPEKAVFLLGCFDGVHRGHRALFEEAQDVPHSAVCVHTFETMPKTEHRRLTDNGEKCRLFREYGADFAVFEDFDSVRTMDGGTFLRERIGCFDPAGFVCGFNYRFGINASCTAEDLSSYARREGLYAMVLPPCTVDGLTVSSTAIRRAVESGDMPLAEAMLGRPYTVASPVLHGNRIGHTIGFPTVNQRLPEGKVCPPRGVYSCTVTLADGTTVGGVCNIGSRPTVNEDENDVTLETNLFGFSGDLYGKTIVTAFRERIRPEKKFDSLDELRRQIEQDSFAARRSLARIRDRIQTEEFHEA